MTKESSLIETVKAAQAGQEKALDTLVRETEPRIKAMIYRTTLDMPLTEDLCQETLLAMIKNIEQCRHPDKFLPWIYRIAQSTIQQHFRKKKSTQKHIAHIEQKERPSVLDGFGQVVKQELINKVMDTMSQLSQNQRTIVCMRCFDEMSYEDIAMALDCSEINARMVFMRAKRSLQKKLSRQGIETAMFVTCLTVFGKLTSLTSAQAADLSISSELLHVDRTTALEVLMRSPWTWRAGLAVAVLALLLMFGSLGRTLQVQDITGMHYTMQLRSSDPNAGSLSKGAYEQFYYYPEGPSGPLYAYMQRWDPTMKDKLCAWLQNANGHYFYASGSPGEVHVNNGPWWWSNKSIRELPNDPVALREFRASINGHGDQMVYKYDPENGLPLSVTDNRFENSEGFVTRFSYNTVKANKFEYPWSEDVPLIDDRDPMHQRGWTWFRIQGKIRGQNVTGKGRIPFIHAHLHSHSPWLVLDLGNGTRLTDTSTLAWETGSDNASDRPYAAGHFFTGLGRPWMGLHTFDILRRDAALVDEGKIEFDASYETLKGWVRIIAVANYDTYALTYHLNMDLDLIETIQFEQNGQSVGELSFEYLEQIEGVEQQFQAPAVPLAADVVKPGGGKSHWLMDHLKD
jgi:RNA polymerase sigma-70 factor (ECF subfamily)